MSDSTQQADGDLSEGCENMVDLSHVPPPWEGAIPLPIEIPET
jgi:hypothetical protein